MSFFQDWLHAGAQHVNVVLGTQMVIEENALIRILDGVALSGTVAISQHFKYDSDRIEKNYFHSKKQVWGSRENGHESKPS